MDRYIKCFIFELRKFTLFFKTIYILDYSNKIFQRKSIKKDKFSGSDEF